MKRCEHDFNDLLNPQRGDSTYDDEFLQNSKRVRNDIKNNIRENNYQCNVVLNKEVSIDEIQKVISKLKNNKSVGNDQIPNEVIKCRTYRYLLFKLVQFNNSLVPTIWKKAIIKPIPKGATKYPFVPLNYRGISLMPCVAKSYSSFINNRIVDYCNELGIFVDEQNGFRPGRSCEDHIFALSNIIQGKVKKD